MVGNRKQNYELILSGARIKRLIGQVYFFPYLKPKSLFISHREQANPSTCHKALHGVASCHLSSLMLKDCPLCSLCHTSLLSLLQIHMANSCLRAFAFAVSSARMLFLHNSLLLLSGICLNDNILGYSFRTILFKMATPLLNLPSPNCIFSTINTILHTTYFIYLFEPMLLLTIFLELFSFSLVYCFACQFLSALCDCNLFKGKDQGWFAHHLSSMVLGRQDISSHACWMRGNSVYYSSE